MTDKSALEAARRIKNRHRVMQEYDDFVADCTLVCDALLAAAERERRLREALESIADLGNGEKYAKAKLYGAVETARAALADSQPKQEHT